MHNQFSSNHSPAYPYYGQPYHTYIPPGYTQQAPRSTFPTPQPPYNTPPDPWPREKVVFPHTTPPRQSPPRDTPFIPPNPDILDAGHTPKPRLKRASTAKPQPLSEKPPLKSALKKNAVKRSDSLSAVPLARTRTSSSARQRLAPTTRTRTISNPSFLPGKYLTHLTLSVLLTASPPPCLISPDHMFVSFHSTNELRLGNVAYQDTLDEIKEHIIPMWPHGVSNQITSPLSWRVTFSRNPWSATGSDAIM